VTSTSWLGDQVGAERAAEAATVALIPAEFEEEATAAWRRASRKGKPVTRGRERKRVQVVWRRRSMVVEMV
jgi:hypothetical protein